MTLDNDNLTVRIFVLSEGSAVQFTESMIGDKQFNALRSFERPARKYDRRQRLGEDTLHEWFFSSRVCGQRTGGGSCTRSSGIEAKSNSIPPSSVRAPFSEMPFQITVALFFYICDCSFSRIANPRMSSVRVAASADSGDVDVSESVLLIRARVIAVLCQCYIIDW